MTGAASLLSAAELTAAAAEEAADAPGLQVVPAPYAPFLDPYTARTPGLFPLAPDAWTEQDAAYAPQMALKDRLVARLGRDAADAVSSQGAALAEEACAMLTAHLLADAEGYRAAPEGLQRPDGVIVSLQDPVLALGRMAQEDWLLLAPVPGAGRTAATRLVAGSLCFPSHWRLQDKIGLTLDHVHDPVPGYQQALDPRVNRVIGALRPESPVQRVNWLATDVAGLAQYGAIDMRNLGGPFYLRCERQTLRRLPETGGVIFGVKTYLTPIAKLDAETRQGFADALRGVSGPMRSYKGGADFVNAVIGALERDPD